MPPIVSPDSGTPPWPETPRHRSSSSQDRRSDTGSVSERSCGLRSWPLPGTTALVSVLAWATFSNTAGTLDRITGERLPALVELSRLAQRSNALIAGAASVVFAGSAQELAAESARVAQAEEAFIATYWRVQDAMGATSQVREVGDVSSRISANLQLLRSAMRNRWELAAQLSRQLEQLEVLHPGIPDAGRGALHQPGCPLGFSDRG